MTIPIRWGILGTGPMAASFVGDLLTLPDAQVVAVGSRDASSANNFAARHGISKHYGSYQDLVKDPAIDVVYIATINTTHRELCLLSLQAGKAVLCEKPFTMNASEAREVVACARSKKLFCMEAMWTRFLPAISRLKQLLQEGAIGSPRMLSAQIGYPFVAEAGGRQFDLALGGGALLDLGVYPIYLASFLFGPPQEVIGRASMTSSGVDDNDAIILRHAGGQLSLLSTSLSLATANEAVVMGTEGQIRLHDPFYRAEKLTIRHTKPIRPMASSGGGQMAKIKKSPVFRALYRGLNPVLTAIKGGNGRTIHLPFAGEGYREEAMEVMRCLRTKKIESDMMPLNETISLLGVMDELRTQWGLKYSCESMRVNETP